MKNGDFERREVCVKFKDFLRTSQGQGQVYEKC